MSSKSIIALLLAAAAACAAGCGKAREEAAGNAGDDARKAGDASAAAAKDAGGEAVRHPVAVLDTTQGKIYIRFFVDKAPEHVKNFMSHCQSGLYAGTYFHRVYPGFMIQGGDPNTKDGDRSNDGLGGYSYRGPGTCLRAEFNDIRHRRGIVSTARSTNPDSAGSQFFIMVADNFSLDRQYTVFGEVISGMDTADRIVSQPGDELPGAGGKNPYEKQLIKSASIEMMTDGEIANLKGK